MAILRRPGLLKVATATTLCEIEFLDFLQPTITTFYIVVPSEPAGAEYLCQIIKLRPIQEIFRADIVLGGDAAHLADHSSVIVLQSMQIRRGWGPGFVCNEHGAPDAWIVNSSSGCDWKWAGGEDGQELTEFVPWLHLVMETSSQPLCEDKQSLR